MKSKIYPLYILIIILSLFVMAGSWSNTSSALASPTKTPSKGEDIAPKEYLLILQLPDPNQLRIPHPLTRAEAQRFAQQLAYKQARPIIRQLAQMQHIGEVTWFEFKPEQHAVAVRVVDRASLAKLAGLPGVTAVIAASEEPVCAMRTAQAMVDQVYGLSQSLNIPSAISTGQDSILSTNPSIEVSFGSWGWSYVHGITSPNTLVTMRLLRGGNIVVTKITTSDSTGKYYIFPSWQYCPTDVYDMVIQPGDVVEVTASGNTVSTVVASLSAWVDPQADTVEGMTNPDRSVEVRLYVYNGDLCNLDEFPVTVSPNPNGDFIADFSGQVDIDGVAYSGVFARDSNANSTYSFYNAYSISTSFDDSDISGTLKPGVAYTAVHRRGVTTLETLSGTTDDGGYFYDWFSDTILAGDVIEVMGGGISLSYTATDLDFALDHTTNTATGTTGANRRLLIDFFKNDIWYSLPTTCAYDDHCASLNADGFGYFSTSTGIDIVRGDGAYVSVYDAAGNSQSAYDLRSPAIVAGLGWNGVEGYWDTHGTWLDITLKDSGGVTKDIQTDVWASSWDGWFDTRFGETVTPGDQIEVVEASVGSEVMTVQDLSTRLDGGSGHLTGIAPSAHLLGNLWDFQRDPYSWDIFCHEINHSGGGYDLTFSGAQVSAQDSVDVWITGPDGHYTRRFSYPFTVDAHKEVMDGVYGFTETTNTSVTLHLWRGGSNLATANLTSGSYGYFALYDDPWGETLLEGDSIEVLTGDGDYLNLPIPELTVNEDTGSNRIYGHSPANEPVRPLLLRASGKYSWEVLSLPTTADGAGNYSASLAGQYWYSDCAPAHVGDECTWAIVDYYDANHHNIWFEGPSPPGIGADVYESDDTVGEASTYSTVQHHSFHESDDVDWTKFTVSAEDTANNIPFLIETINLGPSMDTVLRLYDTDGTTQLEYNDDGGAGLASLIKWTPPSAGVYYVKVQPYSEDSTAYCGASYDLLIMPIRGTIYFPLIHR